MNERILQLAAEAKIMTEESINMKISFNTQLKAFSEKFAELIIRKCAEQIMVKGTDWMDWNPKQLGIRPEYVEMAKHIKDHFGIEDK